MKKILSKIKLAHIITIILLAYVILSKGDINADQIKTLLLYLFIGLIILLVLFFIGVFIFKRSNNSNGSNNGFDWSQITSLGGVIKSFLSLNWMPEWPRKILMLFLSIMLILLLWPHLFGGGLSSFFNSKQVFYEKIEEHKRESGQYAPPETGGSITSRKDGSAVIYTVEIVRGHKTPSLKYQGKSFGFTNTFPVDCSKSSEITTRFIPGNKKTDGFSTGEWHFSAESEFKRIKADTLRFELHEYH